MSIMGMPGRCTARPHTANWFVVAALLLMLLSALPLSARAKEQTVCGPDVKQIIVNTMQEYANNPEKLAIVEKELYAKFSYCAQDAQFVEDSFHVAARQCGAKVSILSSLFYEEMSCCGYDPQRRQFACPVKIKQNFGFGGSPLPGSREYVLHCVQDPSSGKFVQVGFDSVHLSNSELRPTWQFAVISAANDNLRTVQPMDGKPRVARSILSWQFKPESCDYRPIWGNALDYEIRLDQ